MTRYRPAGSMPRPTAQRLAGLVLVGLLTIASGCAGSTRTESSLGQPYAGLQDRSIRALAPERVEDLLAGRGSGYALAAELNHYPGPTHVLELVEKLALEPPQSESVREIQAAMQEEARQLGRQLVDREAELDRAFRGGSITPAALRRLTGEIAEIEGQLRYIHLEAHLQMKQVLSSDQVGRYDELRGYASAGSPKNKHNPAGHGGH